MDGLSSKTGVPLKPSGVDMTAEKRSRLDIFMHRISVGYIPEINEMTASF